MLKNGLSKQIYSGLRSSLPFVCMEEEIIAPKSLCVEQINRYIDWIESLGVQSVMILSPPSIEALCFCYALVLCNKTYIPVHPSTSSELLTEYLRIYPIDLLLVDARLANSLDNEFQHKLLLVQQSSFFYYLPQQPHHFCLLPGIVLFTSGTTGLPKMVHYQYDTISRYIKWCSVEFALNQDDTILFSTELAFVASLRPLFVPILSGTTITFIKEDANKVQAIVTLLMKEKITVLSLTPTLLKNVFHALQNLTDFFLPPRLILLSGEPLDRETINSWFNQISLDTVFYNLYGTTECLVPFYKKITSPLSAEERLHLGELRTGCYYKLLPDALKGYELCIAGEIATAYFDEQLNQDNCIFLDNRRFLRTKDFVSIKLINEQKELFFGSRTQRLIKRHGHLVNLDQIEYVLKKQYPHLHFISFAEEDSSNKIYLVIAPMQEDNAFLEQIKQDLKIHLPSYMHPQLYLFKEYIPLTPNGKIDYSFLRKELREQEDLVLAYFQHFFPNQAINFTCKIVDLGLESIDYLDMAEVFLKATGKWLDIGKITNDTSIATITSCLDYLPVVKSESQNRVQIHPSYKSLYKNQLEGTEDTTHCFVASFCLKGTIDRKKLEVAIVQTLSNHFMLNSKIEKMDKDYFFVTASTQNKVIRRSSLFFPKKIIEPLITSLHAERLVNIVLQKIKKYYYLVIAYHHIALDGWSMALVREEIFRRYAGLPVNELNQIDECIALNQANQIGFNDTYTLWEFKAKVASIKFSEYNQFSSLFQGSLEKYHSCFTLDKKCIDKWAEKHKISTCPSSVLFSIILYEMIYRLTSVKKMFFYLSFSNRNLPIPQIKELLTNIPSDLPFFFDSSNLCTEEFARQVQENVTLYFKNSSYTAIQKIWDNQILDWETLGLSNQPYKIIFSYINKLVDDEYIQNNYIDWNKSTNNIYPGKKKVIFFRVYNMGPQFVVMVNSHMKKNSHQKLIQCLQDILSEDIKE